MNIWVQLLLSAGAILVLVGLTAAVTGTAKRRLTGSAEVAAELARNMIDIDPKTITVSENQRAALALSPDHGRAYLVHTHGDKLVTRVLDMATLTCVESREGLRLHFADIGAAPILMYLPTGMARHWQEIFRVLKNA